MPAHAAAMSSTAAESCPRRIQNHCQPVGLLAVGGSFCSASVLLRARVSSSVRRITRRARLSHVAVSSNVSPRPRTMLRRDCPLRLL